MNINAADVRFPNGDPSQFQKVAVDRLSLVLHEHGIAFTDFRLNVGAKRAFWTSFVFHGKEHVLAVYPDELNIVTDSMIYENYLQSEFTSEDALIASFARRLTRLLRDGVWELPEESRSRSFKEALSSLLRRKR